MEAPVPWILVFQLTGGAQNERHHRGPAALEWDACNDRESRSALRATHERITVSPFSGVSDLSRAFAAERGIRADLGSRRAASRRRNLKGRRAQGRRGGRSAMNLDRFYSCESRR